MEYEEARAEAHRISKEERVVQHVNKKQDGTYYVSDWYDSDSTVISFSNGFILD